MKLIYRSFFIKFLLAAFLCGQLFVGVAQAVAGESPSALEETWTLFDGDSTDTDYGDLTGTDYGASALDFRYVGYVSPERKVHVLFSARRARPEAASSQEATGPPYSIN